MDEPILIPDGDELIALGAKSGMALQDLHAAASMLKTQGKPWRAALREALESRISSIEGGK